ncbi:C3HC zinc finger-like protein [Tasmannia lanceolata]|uniref:C3HC zinc finger-like protein n=1 Tax=Tasmannia lanceolata TaxID=3420 RepID=UPI0040636C31
MADDSEKRFHTVMDKLFYAPRPKRSSTSSIEMQSSGIRKRVKSIPTSNRESSSLGQIVEKNEVRRSMNLVRTQAPLCRPWDRVDLMRRLATFKSMTWFGKPKVVSPENCARRGWVNLEMDIISCEACGARLLFSTPSSWTQQQVEKAAAVFSLKLDSGHKLLCPWIDNACDEMLALFPPTPVPALVEGYNERSSALLQLSALPLISSSAIDYMRSPQLERLLEQSSDSLCSSHDGTCPSGSSRCKELENESEAVSARLYYQAQKIISLCGWDPRLLPYVVVCEDQSTQSAKDAYPSRSSPQIISGKNPGITVYSSTGSNEVPEEKENGISLVEHQSDPASVVLDCKLCGASVGLWAFPNIPRPLEFFRVIESTEAKGQTNSTNGGPNNVNHITEAPSTEGSGKEHLDFNRGNDPVVLKETSSNLNLTIAGGLPPTKQNPRATVSLPIISRHLRTGFGSNSDITNSDQSNVLCIDRENVQCISQDDSDLQCGKDHTEGTPFGQVVTSEDMETLKRKRSENEFCISRGSNFDAQSSLNGEERSGDMSSEGWCFDGDGLISLHSLVTIPDCTRESPVEIMQNGLPDSSRNDTLSENVENSGLVDAEREAIDASGTVKKSEISWKNLLMSSADIRNQHSEDSSRVPSFLEPNATLDDISNRDFRKGDKGTDLQNSTDLQLINHTPVGVRNIGQSPVSNEVGAAYGSGKDLPLVQCNKAMEFDPIRQHRHFCPWISWTNTANLPGWQLTLSALGDGKESSHALRTESPSSLSVYEVDDPITSVRRLFMSPSEKKGKGTCGPS